MTVNKDEFSNTDFLPSTDFLQGAAFIDKKIVPISEAKISLLDWGFLHSDATYDVAHVYNGKFFRLDDHLDRFFNGMEKLRMSIEYSRDDVKEILNQCVSKSGLKEAYVEFIVTRGQPEVGSRDPRTCVNRFYAFAIPFVWIAKPERGLNLIVSKIQRIPAQSVNPTIKNYHWLDLVMGQFDALDKGGETVALVDSKGNLTEGPGFNIFAIKNKTLTTPDEGVLEGITRQTAIEMAQSIGYDVQLKSLSLESAYSADELFITSTAGGIMSIISIDGRSVSDGKIGVITQKLQDKYWALHHDSCYVQAINYLLKK